MQDFTLIKYCELLTALKASNVTYRIMHDIDSHPIRAMEIAKMEYEFSLCTTYYFRSKHIANSQEIIKNIYKLQHSIGYHYESLTTCKGDMAAAYNDFCFNLKRMRHLAPVSTACAHGSPRSPWDSQDIWSQYDIHSLGIDYEPLLDTDFSKTLYLTDTGRRWDGYKVSVRDKVPQYQEQWIKEGLVFHSTDDIIRAIKNPSHAIHHHSLLINTHPQRWMPFGTNWMIEAAVQNIKNIAKRIIVCTKY